MILQTLLFPTWYCSLIFCVAEPKPTHFGQDDSALNPSLDKVWFELDDLVEVSESWPGATESHEDGGSLVVGHVVAGVCVWKKP